MTKEEMMQYDMMVELGIATAEELNLVRCLQSGTWKEIMDMVCFVRSGYRTYEDLIEAIMEEE